MANKNLGAAKANEIHIVDDFKYSYRNKEDVTKLPEGVLIVGSQNVLTNTGGRVQIREGYRLDGQISVIDAPILSSFDWLTAGSGERHVRAGFLTTALNDGRLQWRYQSPLGIITWLDLMTGLTTVSFNFCTFWDEVENIRVMLFVDGTPNIYEWNGAYTELLSATAVTLTKAGGTWAASGFYANGTRSVIINGTTYTYTGGEGTNTLTGVTPSPALELPGSVVYQTVRTTPNSAMTGIPATFHNGLIANLNNQIFVGALDSSIYYISKISNYKDYSFATPRIVGDGWHQTLDDSLVAFKPQEEFMYVSCGQDLWYNISFELQTSTVGVTYEQVKALKLKTGRRQGARSQAYVSHIKNDIVVTTFEPTIDTFGRIETSLATPQTSNISDPIKIDMDSYNFLDGSIAYFRNFIYVAIAREGLVLIYDLEQKSWESPQTLPISRFYVVDGELYGHSYLTSESYKLFTGFADRVYPGFPGFPIDARWVFSFQNFGTRTYMKSANYFYVEGYINANTIATAKITYELDGCASFRTFTIDGTDTQIVCIPPVKGSLGKSSLGKEKLGGAGTTSIQDLPPKFRVEKSFDNTDFFECSISFEVFGTDNRLELLCFGMNARASTQEPVQIRQ